MSHLQFLLANPVLLSVITFLAGAMATAFGNYLRCRLRVFEYRVYHQQVGLSADDSIFGNVRITLDSVELQNLYFSEVILKNTTLKDFTNLKCKIYTGTTILLSQAVSIEKTTCVPDFSSEYKEKIFPHDGVTITDDQYSTYRHSREFLIPVMNRSQEFKARFLTTSSTNNPEICMEILHPGVKLKYCPFQQHFFGVPIRLTLPIGLVLCFIIFVTSAFYIQTPWVGGLVCVIVGLFAQNIAAIIYLAFQKTCSILLS